MAAEARARGSRRRTAGAGIAMTVAGLALFATGEGFVKHLSRDYDVAQIVWGRFTFHAVLFLAVFARAGVVGQMRTARPGLQLARSALLLTATALFFTALRHLPLADAAAINFVAPLLVTAFAIPVLGERVGPRRWIAILVGFAGVLVIIRPGLGAMHWAAILPLGTAVCYALYQLLTRIAARSDDARTSLFWTSAVGVAATSLIAPFSWTPPDAAGWAAMAATGLVFGLGHYLLIRALEVAPASVLAPFIYIQLVWATLIGYAVFGEFPDPWTIGGGAVVIASGLYVWRRETLRPVGHTPAKERRA